MVIQVINFVDSSLNQRAPAGHKSAETPIGNESSHIHCFVQFSSQSPPVRSITIVQYCFRHRLHLYNQSHCCTICFSTQIVPNSIYHNSSILFSTQTRVYDRSCSCFWVVFITDYTQSNWSRHLSFVFSVERSCRLVMSLSCLAFIIDHNQSNQSLLFIIFFGIDHIYTFDYIIV